jgi:hypothetical protein
MPTHMGRKSGKKHQDVVETALHDRAKGIYSIASGWGEKSTCSEMSLLTQK